MVARSAGLLLYRRGRAGPEVLLVHPGGPFWTKRDFGAWTIPKGQVMAGESDEAAARREFEEETGSRIAGELVPLGEVRQAGGKRVVGFAIEGDLDASAIVSTTVSLEWPARSGRVVTFPEIDRACWFCLEDAAPRINAAQRLFLDRLAELLATPER
jgi:predicted NUDIX family NTP pyrophosphohydrolase